MKYFKPILGELRIKVPNAERTVMQRWGIRFPYLQLWVHKIHPGHQHPHTHTQSFWSIILSGSYMQQIKRGEDPTEYKPYFPGSINHVRYDEPHRLHLEAPVWTFFIFYGKQHEAHVWLSPAIKIRWDATMELIE